MGGRHSRKSRIIGIKITLDRTGAEHCILSGSLLKEDKRNDE